jgi:hypothetical protein
MDTKEVRSGTSFVTNSKICLPITRGSFINSSFRIAIVSLDNSTTSRTTTSADSIAYLYLEMKTFKGIKHVP